MRGIERVRNEDPQTRGGEHDGLVQGSAFTCTSRAKTMAFFVRLGVRKTRTLELDPRPEKHAAP